MIIFVAVFFAGYITAGVVYYGINAVLSKIFECKDPYDPDIYNFWR